MSPSAPFAENLEILARKIPPYALMLAFLFLNSVHVPFIPGGAVKAPLFLMGLYYWSIFRPGMFPPWLVFIAGILADLIGAVPLGLNACVFLLVHWTISDQRRFLMGQSFVVIWIGFLIVCSAALLFQWLVFGLVNQAWPMPGQLVFSILLGGALFPLLYVLLNWTYRVMTEQSGELE